jgi:transcriptional regulator with XRE-family HTH domain
VKQLRLARGWSAQRLANELARHDPDTAFDRDVLANFENGRRPNVSIDELLLLSYVFGEPLASFLVPLRAEPSLRLGNVVLTPDDVWDWLIWRRPRTGQDTDRYEELFARVGEDFPLFDRRVQEPLTPLEALEHHASFLATRISEIRQQYEGGKG